MRAPLWTTLPLLLLFVSPMTATGDGAPNTTPATSATVDLTVDLGWLAGYWVSEAWDGNPSNSRGEEVWLTPTRNMMLGINRTVEGDQTRAFEYLRIEIGPEGTAYWASPGGRSATAFQLVDAGTGHAVFENLEHDFPQRIRYRRDGDRLEASIEGTVDGTERSMSWGWRQATGAFGADQESEVLSLVFLETGSRSTELDAEQIREAAEGHRANINRLGNEGVLLLAGPFGEPRVDPSWRGIFVFDESDVEAARTLTESDPAVAMGAFSMRVVPWHTRSDLRHVRALGQSRKAADRAFEGRAYVLGLGTPADAARAVIAPLSAEGLVPMAGTLGGSMADYELFVLAVETVDEAKRMLEHAGVEWQLSAWFATAELMALTKE